MANDSRREQGKRAGNDPDQQRDLQQSRKQDVGTQGAALPAQKQARKVQPRKQSPRSPGRAVEKQPDDGRSNTSAEEVAGRKGLGKQGPAENGAEPGSRNTAEYRREVRD